MIFTFKKGKHRARPLYWLKWFPFLIDPKKIIRKVLFPAPEIYLLVGQDQEDVNKLFGVSFGAIHKHSARFGWRYNPITGKMPLFIYCHRAGKRLIEPLWDCDPGKTYICELVITESKYVFTVMDENRKILETRAIDKVHSRKLAWLLGPYFGGNQTAPKNLNVQLSKE